VVAVLIFFFREEDMNMENVIEFYNYIRQPNLASALIKLTLSVLFGAIIGIERGRKRRPAGLRTHMLVCLGSALTMVISGYLVSIGQSTDVSRLAAQVINGIGFLGAGSIIVTGRLEVKGLTTAASLWTTAIIGLAAGAGCYIEVLFCTFMIILAQLVFSKAEYYLIASSKIMNVYVDFSDKKEIYAINEKISEKKIEVLNTEINKSPDDDGISAVFTLKFPARIDQEEILRDIADLESVRRVEGL